MNDLKMMEWICEKGEASAGGAPAFAGGHALRDERRGAAVFAGLVMESGGEDKRGFGMGAAVFVNAEPLRDKRGAGLASDGGSAFVNAPRHEDKRGFGASRALFVKMGKEGRKPEGREKPGAGRESLVKAEGAARKVGGAAPAAQGALREGKGRMLEKEERSRMDGESCPRAGRPRKRRSHSRAGRELRCPFCGEKFERHASRQRFCSPYCRRQWDNMRGCAERERARLEREAEAEEQRLRDLERERIHAGLIPWPEGLACRDGISPWERDEEGGDAGIWENALLDPLPCM